MYCLCSNWVYLYLTSAATQYYCCVTLQVDSYYIEFCTTWYHLILRFYCHYRFQTISWSLILACLPTPHPTTINIYLSAYCIYYSSLHLMLPNQVSCFISSSNFKLPFLCEFSMDFPETWFMGSPICILIACNNILCKIYLLQFHVFGSV